MICESCGSVMKIDLEKQIYVCEYCGAQQLIRESDEVIIERLKKDLEMEKMKRRDSRTEKRKETAEMTRFKKGIRSKLLIVLVVLCLFFAIVAFSVDKSIAGIVALIQAGCFFLSWLIGMQIIKGKRAGSRTVLTVVGFLMIIVYLAAFGSNIESRNEPLIWPTGGIGAQLPKPVSDRGYAYDSDTNFSATVYQTTEEEYQNYVKQCIEKGFTIESKQSGSNYEAYREDGQRIKLYYYDKEQYMSVRLEAAKNQGEFEWPTSGPGSLLPEPSSHVGTVDWESDKSFTIYVCEMTKKDFNQYIEACKKAGFNKDYGRYDDSFHAKNKAGDQLRINYEGFNTIYVNLYKNDGK